MMNNYWYFWCSNGVNNICTSNNTPLGRAFSSSDAQVIVEAHNLIVEELEAEIKELRLQVKKFAGDN